MCILCVHYHTWHVACLRSKGCLFNPRRRSASHQFQRYSEERCCLLCRSKGQRSLQLYSHSLHYLLIYKCVQYIAHTVCNVYHVVCTYMCIMLSTCSLIVTWRGTRSKVPSSCSLYLFPLANPTMCTLLTAQSIHELFVVVLTFV